VGARSASAYCLGVSLLEVRPVVVVTGISATGKTTVADLLARRFERGVHIKGDVFRRMVVSGRHEMSVRPTEEAWRQLRLRYQLGTATADAYHRGGFAVVLQDVIIGTTLNDYLAAIRSRPLVLVVLCPSAEVVAAREASRGKTAYRSGLSEIVEWDAAFRRETPRIGMWIDTSNQQPADSVDSIVERALELGQIE
jgi:cytidylate kinase